MRALCKYLMMNSNVDCDFSAMKMMKYHGGKRFVGLIKIIIGNGV